jgi:hypothetical protein
MKRLVEQIGLPVAMMIIGGVGTAAGCGTGSGVQQTDSTPLHAPAATEAEALERCSNLRPERKQECIDIVKQRFHDTSK